MDMSFNTEGDSFLLALHDVQDAVRFAVSAQKALMEADWPRELLEVKGCRPICMKKTGCVSPFHRPPHDEVGGLCVPSCLRVHLLIGKGTMKGAGHLHEDHQEVQSSYKHYPELAFTSEVPGIVRSNTSGTVEDRLFACWECVSDHNVTLDCSRMVRGLRVRMGIHAGVPEPKDVHLNSVMGRVQYRAEGLRRA